MIEDLIRIPSTVLFVVISSIQWELEHHELLWVAHKLEIIFRAISWVCFLEAHAKIWVIFAWVDEYFFDERLKFFISSCILILLRAI